LKALVTGVGGFIGSSLASELVRRGDDVRGLDNFLTGFRQNVPDGVALVEGDLRNLDDVRGACEGVEIIFHQGALRSVPKSVDNPLEADRCNVGGTLNILVAARDAGVRKVVYASSSSVYGDPAEPLRVETQAPDPVSPYAVSKMAGEHYCRAWTAVHGLSTVSLRYFNVFGPRQHPDSKYSAVFPAFVGSLLRGRAPEIHWDGEQSRDFTYIDDIVAANLAAAAAGPDADGQAFNIGAGRPKKVSEVLRSVSDVVGTWIEPVHSPKRAGDVRHTLADISKARRILGWEPKADWDEGVRACVDWFRAALGKTIQ
jgi:UDP-N-acetylglucosamine/UDP-N-acetyl-alpha-D-glucosaminouronate 4-epimerase